VLLELELMDKIINENGKISLKSWVFRYFLIIRFCII
jgi:hypothetical protein